MIARLATTAFALLLTTQALAAEQFTLAIPGQPAFTSQAVLHGSALFIRRGAETHQYQYEPQLNTYDGRFVGFYCPQLLKAIRWPISGSGQMQIYENGTWRASLMHVIRHQPTPVFPQVRGGVALRLPPNRPTGPGPVMAPPHIGPTHIGPTQLGPTQLGPTQLGPTQLGPTQLGPNPVGPAQVGPQFSPTQLGPSQIAPRGTTGVVPGVVFDKNKISARRPVTTVTKLSPVQRVLQQHRAIRAAAGRK